MRTPSPPAASRVLPVTRARPRRRLAFQDNARIRVRVVRKGHVPSPLTCKIQRTLVPSRTFDRVVWQSERVTFPLTDWAVSLGLVSGAEVFDQEVSLCEL